MNTKQAMALARQAIKIKKEKELKELDRRSAVELIMEVAEVSQAEASRLYRIEQNKLEHKKEVTEMFGTALGITALILVLGTILTIVGV